MPRFRSNPTEVEAVQLTQDNIQAVKDFAPGIIVMVEGPHYGGTDKGTPGKLIHAEIKTLEGTMIALPGDWIIKGIKGEFYPCKPDIFALRWSPL